MVCLESIATTVEVDLTVHLWIQHSTMAKSLGLESDNLGLNIVSIINLLYPIREIVYISEPQSVHL